MVLRRFDLHAFVRRGPRTGRGRQLGRDGDAVFALVCAIHLHLAFAVRETLQSRELALLLGSVEKV